jgi:large subunit ribosomal protein L10
MTREEKNLAVEELKEMFRSYDNFYLTDSGTLTVGKVNQLRALCYEKGIEMKVVKNTLARKAMEQLAEEKQMDGLYPVLKGFTAIMFSTTGNAPGKLIKKFREDSDRPLIKAAYIDSAIFLGDDQLDNLASLKSKEELVGDIVFLLQSPAKNVISALKSGGSTIAGLIKALEERASN